MKKKILVVLLLITLSLPLFAGDHFDISLGFGHYTNFKKANSLSLYYGSTIGLTDRLELVVGGVSEVTPNVFSANELQLGLAFAIMGQRSTATKVAGSSINTLVGAGLIVSDVDGRVLPSGAYLNITPVTIGTPIHGRRERAFEIGCQYDWFTNKFNITFSFLKLDFYLRGSYKFVAKNPHA